MVSVEFLQSHSLFGGVSPKDIERIRPRLREEHFAPGQDIIKEGETGNSLYLITKGAVDVIKTIQGPDGKPHEKKIAELKRGDIFGEMELIDIEPRTATIRAKTEVTALTLSGMDLYEVTSWSPQVFTVIIMNLSREISRRLRKMDSLAVEYMIEKELREKGFFDKPSSQPAKPSAEDASSAKRAKTPPKDKK